MKKLISIGLVSIFAFSMMVSVTFAQAPNTVGGVPEISADLGDVAGDLNLSQRSASGMLRDVVQALLGFLAILAVIVVLVGGFKWMTSGGNEEKVASARQMLIAGVIGLAIVLSAFAIVNFVVGEIT